MKILGIGNAIVDVICKVDDKFISQNNLTKSTMKLVDENEFKKLWNSERTGILFPSSMFEDQGDSSDFALNEMLEHIWQDAVAVCGIEMHRRVLSLAHNADFEEINDTKKRSKLEARNLMMGRDLILNNNVD